MIGQMFAHHRLYHGTIIRRKMFRDLPDVTDMLGIGSEAQLAQPDLAELDPAQPGPAEPDPGERSHVCMRCRNEDAPRQARQEGGG